MVRPSEVSRPLKRRMPRRCRENEHRMKTTLRVGLALMLSSGAAEAVEWPDLAKPGVVQGGGEKDAAVVVGIENYAYVSRVPGAAANANDWYAWLTKSRKVPIGRVRLLRNEEGTLEQLRAEAEWAASTVKPGGTLWFVFIGHGAPAPDGKDGVLVGADVQQRASSLYARSLRQQELLATLGKGAQARTVNVVDACFSGRTSAKGVLVESLQPMIAVSARAVGSNVVVLTAGRGDQFAGPLPGANRPAFSYLALGALRGWADENGDGQVTAEEVAAYTNDALTALVKDRRQTPELAGNGALPLSGGAKERGPDLVAMVMSTGGGPAPEAFTETGPRIKRGAVTKVTGDFTVDARPRQGVRLELTDPEGRTQVSGAPYKNPEAAVGRWRVVAKAEGYSEEHREVQVPADEVTVEKVELKRLGGLQIGGSPAGAAVKVTGPNGFSDESGLPWEAEGLSSGSYQVKVRRAGYADADLVAEVKPGETAKVEVKLEKAGAGQGGCPPGMALVAGGSFKMGDRGDQVTVRSYCLDMTEVTVEAYAACAQRGNCAAAATTVEWSGITSEQRAASSKYCNGSRSDRAKHPVNCVDWSQAAAYCQATSKRLPTEEEWEWAARGGSEGRTYPWGETAPTNQLCWNGAGSDLGKGARQSTCEVGSFRAGGNPQGIQDLAGNVWEWTATASGSDRVGRGGSWFNNDASYVRAAHRGEDSPSDRGNSLGFRCARTQ